MVRTKNTARKRTSRSKGKYPKAKFGDQGDADDEHCGEEPEPGTSQDSQEDEQTKTKQIDPNIYIVPQPKPKPKGKKGVEKRKSLPSVKQMTIEQKIWREQKRTVTCCSKRFFGQ